MVIFEFYIPQTNSGAKERSIFFIMCAEQRMNSEVKNIVILAMNILLYFNFLFTTTDE